LEKFAVQKSLSNGAQSVPKPATLIADGTGAEIVIVPDLSATPPVVIPLTSRVFNQDGIKFLIEAARHSVDHIICDPDFAVSTERLEAGTTGAAEGVNQTSIDQSLSELHEFIGAAYSVIKERGFLAFFYDLDHHEKIGNWGRAAGFAVQRWPITWHKTDYRGNASPQHNTTKNEEWIYLMRKAGTVIAKDAPELSVWPIASASAAKEFGHPFAKPRELWKRLFDLCCIKGQTVLDPFAGSGSSTVSAIEWGLNPIACEIQEQHYNTLVLNCQKEYKKLVGDNVQFT